MGFSFGKFAQILAAVGPQIMALAGVPTPIVGAAVHGIQIAEDAAAEGPKSGAQKKAIALDAVQTFIGAANQVKAGSVDPQITNVVGAAIDATVGAVNAIQRQPISVPIQ